jgi:hypothetical protein
VTGINVAYLIHILAQQETPMKARSTELGFEPAKLRTLVIKIRSMLVLLKADEIVNPLIRSMIVGENITENIYLDRVLSISERVISDNLLCCIRRRQGSVIVITYNP